MKNGFRIWDTDTHIHPTLEVVAPYFDPGFRARLPELEPYKVAVQPDDGIRSTRFAAGRHNYALGKVAYKRILGQAEPPATPVINFGKFQGTRLPAVGVIDDDVDARIRDMNDFCGKHPERLKALLVPTGTAVEDSVREIRTWGKSRWAVGVWPFPGNKPLDHPDMDPIWPWRRPVSRSCTTA